MRTAPRLRFIAVAFALMLFPVPGVSLAQSPTANAKQIALEIAAHSQFIAQIRVLERSTDELGSKQAFAVLAAVSGWKLYYDLAQASEVPITLRLYNAIDEARIPIIRASQAASRLKTAAPEHHAEFALLLGKVEAFMTASEQLLKLLQEGRTEEAAEHFRDNCIPQRDSIRDTAYSLTATVERAIGQLALEAR